jgi:phosphate-selective porin OprO/OprP
MKRLCCLALTLALASIVSPARAGDEEPSGMHAALPSPRPVELFWDKGFGMRTRDREFELRLLGIVQADAVGFLGSTNPDNHTDLFVRRARLYVEGQAFRFFDYRFMLEFGRGRAELLDGFVDIHLAGNTLRLRAGKFKQPFSYEQFVMEDRTLAVFERSMIDQLTPARNVGLMLQGKVGKTLDWAASVTNGVRDGDFDEPGRNEKDVLGRASVQPFATTGLRHLAGLLLGVSVGYGREKDAWDPGNLRTPLRINWFSFQKGIESAGGRTRFSPELYYFDGPFAAGGQWLKQEQVLKAPGRDAGQVDFEGWFGMASVVLTGEHRASYAEFIDPRRPFHPGDPRNHPGAFELLLRASALRVGGAAFDPRYRLADPTQVSAGAHEVSVDLNWYMNRFAWLMLDAEHAWYTSAPRPGAVQRRVTNALGGRLTVMW